jgi:hypothetical protein
MSEQVWMFQMDGSSAADQHGARRHTQYEAAFAGDFYDDIVVGVQKIMSVGLSLPAVLDDEVYFGSADGNLYAIH